MSGPSALARLALALLVLPLAAALTAAQQPEQKVDETVRPPRVRLLLRSALDHYKSNDYELADKLFTQVQQGQEELTSSERNDFRNFAKKNSEALAGRREGGHQRHVAVRAGHHGCRGRSPDGEREFRAHRRTGEKWPKVV